MKPDAHAFQERGHRPLRGLRVSELRSQVGNLLPRCLEIGLGCGSRLGDCQDLGLQPLNELSVGFGPGVMLRDLLGVPGPLGLELGLEFGPEPGPLGLDGLEMIGRELVVQIQQLAQPGLKHSDFRPGRLKLFPGLVVLSVQPASFIAMCLLGTDKGAVKLVDLPTQLFAFLLKFLLAPGQRAAQLSRLGRVCLPQGGQPFQLIELRGKLVVSLTELLGKLVTLGIPIAELSLEVPKLFRELVALSMNAVQPVIELLDPPVELFGLETGQAYLFLAIRDDLGKPKTGGQLGPQALHLVAQPFLVFIRAWCHPMVGPEDAKLVLTMFALHLATAVGKRDSQADQTVRTNRLKVRGLLAHGRFPRARKWREL